MKRIALLILLGFFLLELFDCNNLVEEQTPDDPDNLDHKKVSLKILVPPKSVTTYAGEDASALENSVDTLFVNLFQGVSTTPIRRDTFGVADFDSQIDSIISISYEVDNISSGARVEVFANHLKPKKLSATEVPIPRNSGANFRDTYFYMSGKANLTFNGTAFEGQVHILRNVAKVRIHVTKNNVVFPSDLEIDYNRIAVQIVNAPDSTTAFEGEPITPTSGIGYFDYPERLATTRRGASFNTTNGGLIDSLYLYENLRTSYTTATTSQIKITIPTLSASEGNKVVTKYYTLQTTPTNLAVLRNYIYTLYITVKGQELEPLISLEVLPWNDVPVNGDILGTYLTLNKTEIDFDQSTGIATINFCSDAQAIYFDFKTFNNNNPTIKLGQQIKLINIDTTRANFPLAPNGFQDAQILLDKGHCGSFGFDISGLPNWQDIIFSGNICLRAGNIVQCLSFPARLTYDAHFIVGEPLLPGEQFTSVTSDASWLEISHERLYTLSASSSWSSGSASAVYLHLNENLTTSNRTGILTLTNANGSKKVYVSQLPAIFVGRFGYNNMSASDDSLYTAGLYTEQLYEFSTMPIFGNNGTLTNNPLYNGRYPAISVFDAANYSGGFNYHASPYAAINYCAYKNRPSIKNSTGALATTDIKWYLPAQAQLMAMWITYESYNYYPSSNFSRNGVPADTYWSSTANALYSTQSQYVNFRYGNVGHFERVEKYWARCVRDGEALNPMILRGVDNAGYEFPTIRFDLNSVMPVQALSFGSKATISPPISNIAGDENSYVNATLYFALRVAKFDVNSNALMPWALNLCSTYTENDSGNPYPNVPAGYWRLPTQKELQAIWILQHDIKKVCPTFELLSNNYYWSATDASTTSGTSVWTVFGGLGSRSLIGGAGNTPHQLKTTPLRVRCVAQYSLP